MKRFRAEISREGQQKLQELDRAFDSVQDLNMSISDANELDKTITNILRDKSLVNDRGQFNQVGQEIKDIQELFREKVMGTEGGANLKEARKLWSRQLKLRDLETDVEIAMLSKTNPKTALQTAMKTRLKKIRQGKLKGYTKEEIDLIKKAADDDNFGALMNFVSGRLASSVSLGTGNVPLASALRLTSEAAQQAGRQVSLLK